MIKPIIKLLNKREFISMATSDLQCRPNAAPKLVLSADEEFIYLVDYSEGRTWENLKVNPRASLSFHDSNELKSYQINGRVEIIKGNEVSQDITQKLEERKIALTVERIISGVRREKKHAAQELSMPEKFVVYKVKPEEFTEIFSQGDFHRHMVNEAKAEELRKK